MKITVSAKEFNVFLNAILRVEKEGSVITVHKDYMEALTLTENLVSLLVYTRINILNSDEIDEEKLVDQHFDRRTRQMNTTQGQLSIGIKDLRKFQKLLDMNGDSDTFTFEVKDNYIYFSNELVKGARFMLGEKDKIRATHSSVITPEWFNSFEKTMKMDLDIHHIKNINGAAAFVSENVRKVYFYQDGEDVYAEVNDKTKSNVDNISFKIGTPSEGKMQAPVIVDANALNLIYDKCPRYILESSWTKSRNGTTTEILFLSAVSDNVLIKYLVNGQKN